MKDGVYVNHVGDRLWYCDYQLHREDGPAVERASGAREWWVDGQLHRDSGPAKTWPNGECMWYVNGKLHRDNGPACEWANGNHFWYLNGQRYDFVTWCTLTNQSEQTRTLLYLRYPTAT